MNKRSFLLDIFALGLLIYAASHFGIWYMQQVWAQTGQTLPATEFTDGHLIGTTVGMHEVLEGRLGELYTVSVGYPDGLIFRPLMWPAIVMGILIGPILSLNYIFTYMPAFNAIGGYLAARSMRLHPFAAITAGIMFAWNPWVRETLGNGQFEQSAVGVIGMIWASAFLCERKPKLGMACMMFTVAGCGVAVPNCTLAGLLSLPVFAVFRILQKKQRWRKWALAIGAAVLAGLIVNHYQSINFEQTQPQFFRPRQVSDQSMISQATIQSMLTPPEENSGQHHVLHLTFLGFTWLTAGALAFISGGFYGLMAIAAALFMAHFALGPSMTPDIDFIRQPIYGLHLIVKGLTGNSFLYRIIMGILGLLALSASIMSFLGLKRFWRQAFNAKKLTLSIQYSMIATTIGMVFFLMAALSVFLLLFGFLGPNITDDQNLYLPMAWLQEHVKILSRSGSYYRFVMGSYTAFAIAAAVVAHRYGRIAWPLGVLVMVGFGYNAIKETNELPGHQPPIPYRVAYWNKELSQLKGGSGAVLDLPLLKGSGCDKNSFRYINSFWLHRRSFLHTMEPPVAYRSNERDIGRLQRALKKENCADLVLKHLKSMDVGAVVVHKKVVCALSEEQIQCLRDALSAKTINGVKINENVRYWEGGRVMFWDGIDQSD